MGNTYKIVTGQQAPKNELQEFINSIASGNHLSLQDSGRVFQIIMKGGATPAQIAAILIALRINKETVDEISGAAMALRTKAKKLELPDAIKDIAIDTCGTGGDGKGTYNISTTVAFVLAACGLPVAKHGNKAVSSNSGSADVLTALGVNVDITPEQTLECLNEAGICFMLAPLYHSAMRHVGTVRQELGVRTIFNLLGPVINPAMVNRQILGVYSKDLVEPMAKVLANLGATRAWVVHGLDGMDEISVMSETFVAELKDGEVKTFTIDPKTYGIEPPEDENELIGGDGVYNAQALKNILSGQEGAYRNAVIVNAAAGLIVGEKATDFRQAIAMAAEAIDSGKAKARLEKLVEISNSEIAEEDV